MNALLLVSMMIMSTVGLSMQGATTPPSLDPDDADRRIVLTISGKDVYSIKWSSLLYKELQTIVNAIENDSTQKIEFPIDTLKGLVPDIQSKIKDWMDILTLFYEGLKNEKMDEFDKALKDMPYVDLIEFNQMCNYFNASGIQDYFFKETPQEELKEEDLKRKKPSVSIKKEPLKFIPLLLDKAAKLDLKIALAPFIRKTGEDSFETDGDILGSGNAQKKLLINYLKKNILKKNRGIGPEYPLLSRESIIPRVAWSSQNILALGGQIYLEDKITPDNLVLFTVNDHIPTVLQVIKKDIFSAINFLSWNSEGTRLAIGLPCLVDIYENTGIWQTKYQFDAPSDSVICDAQWSPDNATLAIATYYINRSSTPVSYEVKIIVLHKQRADSKWVMIQVLSLPCVEKIPKKISIAWNPKGHTLAVANGDTLYFFEQQKSGFILTHTEPAPPNNSLVRHVNRHSFAWSPNGKILAFLENSMGSNSFIRNLVFMEKNSDGRYEKKVKLPALVFNIEPTEQWPVLSWSPNGKILAISHFRAQVSTGGRNEPTQLFNIANNTLTPLIDYATKPWEKFDAWVVAFHWESHSVLSSIDHEGVVRSVLLHNNVDFLADCWVNQLFILLITQVMQNSLQETKTGAVRIVSNQVVSQGFLKKVFEKFPPQVKKELYDFMPDLIDKPIATPSAPSVVSPAFTSSSSSSSSGLDIKKSLQQLAQDMKLVAQKI